MNFEKASAMLDALGHPKRLEIFHLVAKAGEQGLSVGSLVDRLSMPGATLSHHLSKLTRAALVRQERQGTTLICRAERDAVMALSAYLLRSGE